MADALHKAERGGVADEWVELSQSWDTAGHHDVGKMSSSASRAVPAVSSLVFRDLRVSLPNGKRLLDGVSGILSQSVGMLFVMGPSGAGKTTFLDTLMSRVAGTMEGVVRLDGAPASRLVMESVVRFVPQFDTNFGGLSVREIFGFTARFHDSVDLVDEVVATLGLRDQLDTPFGDAFRRGLSTGQKKRVSIGVALLSRPRLLILDEPGSGLDAAAAHHVMVALRRIANTLVPIILTVHQPTQVRGVWMASGPLNITEGAHT